MSRLNILLFLISGTVLAVLHFISVELYLYWRFLWLDIPMHALGGATVALSVFTLAALRVPFTKYLVHFVPTILIVCVVAIVWEVFEFYVQVPLDQHYVRDTAADLIMGFIGGIIGFLVARSINTLSV